MWNLKDGKSGKSFPRLEFWDAHLRSRWRRRPVGKFNTTHLRSPPLKKLNVNLNTIILKRFCWLIDIGHMRGTVGKRVSTLSLSAIAVRERVGQSVSERQEGQMTELLHHSAWIWMKADQRIQQGRLLCFIDREIFDQTSGGVIWQQLPIGKWRQTKVIYRFSTVFIFEIMREYSLVSWSTTAYQRFPTWI